MTFRRPIYTDDTKNSESHWVGYLFYSDTDKDRNQLDTKYRLAGTYEQIEDSGRNHSGGWYATIDRTEVVDDTNDTFS